MGYQSLKNWQFKLQTLIRFQISDVQALMKWGFEMNWTLVGNHNPFPGSKVWGKISKAWKRVAEKLDFSHCK
jgi:hypothetical protein